MVVHQKSISVGYISYILWELEWLASSPFWMCPAYCFCTVTFWSIYVYSGSVSLLWLENPEGLFRGMNIDWLTPVCWLNPKAAGLTMNKWEGDCTRLLLIFLKKTCVSSMWSSLPINAMCPYRLTSKSLSLSLFYVHSILYSGISVPSLCHNSLCRLSKLVLFENCPFC